MGIECQSGGSLEIAKRSRGTPRIANRLLRRVRDFAEVRADGVVTVQVADDALNLLHVDERGFDQMDGSSCLCLPITLTEVPWGSSHWRHRLVRNAVPSRR